MALTPEQSKKLLDSLFALPDKTPKAKAPKPAKQVKAAPSIDIDTNAIAKAIQRNKNFRPTLAIIEVVHQHCTTCNTTHQFIRSRLVRFETVTKGQTNTAYEFATVVPENLPRRVDHAHETTEVCPTCLEFSSMFEDYLAVADRPIQQELFHG